MREGVAALRAGDARRTTAATAANAVSSRSHTIFTVHVAAVDRRRNTARRSKMNFVDLAGSERTSAVCDVASRRFKESTAINTGLHYLEQVIVSLQGRAAFVPYRNSKLTHILQDSLGGRTLTAMLATVTPLAATLPESLSTCHFSQRVACIANTSVLHRETVLNPMGEIRRLRREVALLQKQLLLCSQGGTSISQGTSSSSSSTTSTTNRDLFQMVQTYMESSQPVLDVRDLRECQECFALMRDMYRARGAPRTRPARASSLEAVPVVPPPPSQQHPPASPPPLPPRAGSSPARTAGTLRRHRDDAALHALRQRLLRDAARAQELHQACDAQQLALRRAVLTATVHGTQCTQKQQEELVSQLCKCAEEYRTACARVEADRIALFEAAVARLDGSEYGAMMNNLAARADRARDVRAQVLREAHALRSCVVRRACGLSVGCGDADRAVAMGRITALCKQFRAELRGIRDIRDQVLADVVGPCNDEQK